MARYKAKRLFTVSWEANKRIAFSVTKWFLNGKSLDVRAKPFLKNVTFLSRLYLPWGCFIRFRPSR